MISLSLDPILTMLLKRTIFSQKSGPNADAKTFEKTIALFDAKFERKPNLLYK